VRVYVLGLAGDIATPDIITEFWESDPLRPTTADRTITVDASGQVNIGAIANDAITAASLNNDAVTEIQAGLSTFDSTTDPVSVDDMQVTALAQFFTVDSGETEVTAIPGSVVYEIAATGTIFPAGAVDYTYTVTRSDTLAPVSGVDVWVSTDNPATNIIWRGTTDTFGVARDVNDNKPQLDPGTYYFWKQIAAFVDDQNPDTEVVP